MSDDLEAARKSSESWYWWGIPTFFRCPWNEDPHEADIAQDLLTVGGGHVLRSL